MPTNKHAIIRYRTIDRCIRDLNQQWTWRELAEACQSEIYRSTGKSVKVSERTIKYDISAMRSDEVLGYFAPIDYDRKEKSYYYTDPKYTLTESPINQSDKELLRNAVDMISKFAESSQIEGLQKILTKLESKLDRRKTINDPIIQFDQTGDVPGQEWLYQLYLSIKQNKALTIQYHPYGKPASNRIISPQLLKEYNGRWYLLAFDHRAKDTRLFALDRIKNTKESLAKYHPIPSREAKKYFDQVVGVSVFQDKKVKKIVFEAYGNQLHYFKTKPLHRSQKIIMESEKKAMFQIEVILNYELISELLSYQNNIRILKPQSLLKEVKKVLQMMSELYK